MVIQSCVCLLSIIIRGERERERDMTSLRERLKKDDIISSQDYNARTHICFSIYDIGAEGLECSSFFFGFLRPSKYDK